MTVIKITCAAPVERLQRVETILRAVTFSVRFYSRIRNHCFFFYNHDTSSAAKNQGDGTVGAMYYQEDPLTLARHLRVRI